MGDIFYQNIEIMKKSRLAFIIMIATTMVVFGQEPLAYTEVVQVDSVSKNELYNRAKVWFATTYNSVNDVLQIDNKEEGMLIGKAIMKYEPNVFTGSEQTKGNIKYTIKIFVKDGRYKYEITDFIHDPYGNQYGKSSMGLITTDKECPNPKPMAKGWSNKVWNDIKSQIEDNVTSLINSLKQGMSKRPESKKDDW
ncbi:MAG: DUF4468 domain-containing protein [Bacteroidia bacterium]